MRWQHPERGLLPPGEFVPLAEQTGVMRQLTDRVLEQRARPGRRAGAPTASTSRVAVNVSASNLLEPGWADAVAAALGSAGVAAGARSLHRDHRERAAGRPRARARRRCASLGDARRRRRRSTTSAPATRRSAYLKQLAVDELKIDRSFVDIALRDPADAAIVQAVAGLAGQLGLRVVAEGVEDEATLRAVAEWGASYAQGYYLSRPVPAEELSLEARRLEPARAPRAVERVAVTQAALRPPAARPALAALGPLTLGHRRGDRRRSPAPLQAARELRREPRTAAPSRTASGATSISERSRSIARTTAAATCSGVRVPT